MCIRYRFGANCGIGAADLFGALLAMVRQIDDSDILVAKSNCGIPAYVDGRIQYSGTPELMAEYARLALNAGARIIGGCCGTTPNHLEAMRRALESHQKNDVPDIDTVVGELGPITEGTRARCFDIYDSPDTRPVRKGRRHRNR